MTKQFRAVLLAATVGFAPVAWAQSKPVTVSIFAQDIGTLDPDFAVGTQDRAVVAWIYNALVRFNPAPSTPASWSRTWRSPGTRAKTARPGRSTCATASSSMAATAS